MHSHFAGSTIADIQETILWRALFDVARLLRARLDPGGGGDLCRYAEGAVGLNNDRAREPAWHDDLLNESGLFDVGRKRYVSVKDDNLIVISALL